MHLIFLDATVILNLIFKFVVFRLFPILFFKASRRIIKSRVNLLRVQSRMAQSIFFGQIAGNC